MSDEKKLLCIMAAIIYSGSSFANFESACASAKHLMKVIMKNDTSVQE